MGVARLKFFEIKNSLMRVESYTVRLKTIIIIYFGS